MTLLRRRMKYIGEIKTNMDNYKTTQPFNITRWKHNSFGKSCSCVFSSSEQSSWSLWSEIASAFISPDLISHIKFDFFCIFSRLSLLICFLKFSNLYFYECLSFLYLIFLLSFQFQFQSEVTQFLQHSFFPPSLPVFLSLIPVFKILFRMV